MQVAFSDIKILGENARKDTLQRRRLKYQTYKISAYKNNIIDEDNLEVMPLPVHGQKGEIDLAIQESKENHRKVI